MKQVLITNNRLREELLNASDQKEEITKVNFQLSVENEDLHDKLAILKDSDGSVIEYLPHLEEGEFD